MGINAMHQIQLYAKAIKKIIHKLIKSTHLILAEAFGYLHTL